MHRIFLLWRFVLISALAGFSHSSLAAERIAAARPNVLFLFTDDQRADTIGALGNPHIKTPNLDALARTGLAFRNAYCLGGNQGAVCTPSRNMLLSGRAYFRWQGNFASANDPNFPVSMREAGYVTYHHGKRGNSAVPIQGKFEHNHYLNEAQERASGQPGQAIVDAAIEFLRTKLDPRPFFMYLAFEAPHDPRIAAQEYLDLYERDKIPLPKNFLPQHPFDNGEQVIRDEMLAPWPRTPDVIRRHLHEYYAVISGIDRHIGRLIRHLKDLGEFENTIIIFSSDHGLALGSHGLMGKQNLYEDGMKAPLIFTGPGIRKGRSDALVYLFDIFPTVCALAGVPIPVGLDGRSLKPIIEGKKRSVRETLFLSYRDVQRAVRDDRWKLIRYPLINKTQLFDLRKDPHELRDLAEDASQAKRIGRMMASLRDWQVKLGDNAALESANPQSPTFTPPSGEALAKLREKWKM